MTSIEDHRESWAKLRILEVLSQTRDYRANDHFLQVDLDRCASALSREAFKRVLSELSSQRAVEFTENGGLIVVALLKAGQDHLNGLAILSGVAEKALRH